MAGNTRQERLAYDSGERVRVIVEGETCIELTIGPFDVHLDVQAVRRVITALQHGLALIEAKDPL